MERTVNPKRLERFMAVYSEALTNCVDNFPDEYPWYPDLPVSTVVERMRAALERGSYAHDGKGFKATCKTLGIRHTRTEIERFLIANWFA